MHTTDLLKRGVRLHGARGLHRRLLLMATPIVLLLVGSNSAQISTTRTCDSAAPNLARMPIAFIANHGQWPASVRFAVRGELPLAWFERDAIVLSLNGADRHTTLRLSFQGQSHHTRVRPGDRMPGVHNFYLGANPSLWRNGVPAYRCILYENVYPGAHVQVRGKNGHLEYDVFLEAGADLSQVAVRCGGAEHLRIESDGGLVIAAGGGTIRQPIPATWQTLPSGEKQRVACRYRLIDETTWGFEVPERNECLPLVIDPALEYSTFLGGSGQDSIAAVHVGPAGITVAGWTTSPNMPSTLPPPRPVDEAFVARFSSSGSALVFATYLGGSSSDGIGSMTVDTNGDVIVAGQTWSSDFPIPQPSFDRFYGGGRDAFVARLNSSGARLRATYLGGASLETNPRVHLHTSGDVVVVGSTKSSRFPTTPTAYDASHNGGEDCFVTRLNSVLSTLVYSTFVGGTNDEVIPGAGAAVDGSGLVTFTGWTDSADFPATTGAFDTSHNGGRDAFVTRIGLGGAPPVYSTFVGGTQNDEGHGLAFDATSGEAVVVGVTASQSFPVTVGSYDTTFNGGALPVPIDAFAIRLNAAGSTARYSTFMGGSQNEVARAVTFDPSGAAIVAGESSSQNFPTTHGAFDTSYNGSGIRSIGDAFVLMLSATGSHLPYSTFLGDADDDRARSVVSTAPNEVVVVGSTWSSAYPTTPGAFDNSHNGNGAATFAGDGFITKLRLGPVLSFVGAPRRGNQVHFRVSGTPSNETAATAIVGWSCSGTTGFPVSPLIVPLTFDSCTLLSLSPTFAPVLQTAVSPSGTATFPAWTFPAVPPNIKVYCAAVTLLRGAFVSVTPPISFVTQ